MTIYGTEIERSDYNPRRSVLAEPETTGTGNVVLRVGRENDPLGKDVNGKSLDGTWEKTEHVVLTPEEADEYGIKLRHAARKHAARERLA